ncbi:hypothetical protein G9A89_010384 [Geosiphon pyriformis]|nr:hypothetical protein G9A89_010384 [Geosiphon pyriformis]
MQDTRPNSYSAQHDLERLFDELKGALLRHQPTVPLDFLISCLNEVQQKRELKEPFQYSVIFNEYATRSLDYNAQCNNSLKPGSASKFDSLSEVIYISLDTIWSKESSLISDLIIRGLKGGSSRKRPRSQDDPINNRTPPYTEPSTSLSPPSNEETQSSRHLSFANSPSAPRQNLSPRFFNNQPPPFRRGRRNSVSAESIKPSEHCNNVRFFPKDALAKRQIEEATQNNLLFRNLDKEIKTQIMEAMFEKPVKKGEVVIRQGDEGDNFYVVNHGMFEILVDDRKVVTVADGGSFGELALMYNNPRAATVRATTDGTLWAVDRQTFLSTITTHMYRKRKTYEDFLKSIDIFKCLQSTEITKLADALEPIDYQSGETIITQGDPGEYFYIIEKGCVDVWKNLGNGTTHRLPGLSAGRYFGELALIRTTVVANGPVSLVALRRDSFDRLLGSIGKVMDNIRRNAQMYDVVGIDSQSALQPPSPASPVPERSGVYPTGNNSASIRNNSIDSMVIDDPPINNNTNRNNMTTPRRSGYSGAGGVNVL